MTTQQTTLSAAGNSTPIRIDMSKDPGLGLLLNVPGGVTFTGGVQMAGGVNGPWNDHDTMVGISASANGDIAFPVTYVRLTASVLSGGTVTLTVMQKGSKS